MQTVYVARSINQLWASRLQGDVIDLRSLRVMMFVLVVVALVQLSYVYG